MRSTRTIGGAGAGGLALVFLAGCRAPIDSLNPVTPRGGAIADLFGLALILSLVVFLLVTGVLIYVIIRFRDSGRPGDPEPPQVHGNMKLEIAWTAAPVILLAVLFILTVQTMRTVGAAASAGGLPIRVIGHQWWWEYQYPGLGIVTANELHVPVGQPIELEITAADVIHAFWVPQLGWKKDAIPGGWTTGIVTQFDQAGVYDGWCTEYCGTQHAWMRVRLIAEPREQFDAWVRQQQQPAATPQAATALRGQELFLRNTCVNCHAVRGTAAAAQVGPDLTHFGGRSTIGAGVVDNTPENLHRWIREVQAVKPGALMPNYTAMSDEEIAALVEYLGGLK